MESINEKLKTINSVDAAMDFLQHVEINIPWYGGRRITYKNENKGIIEGSLSMKEIISHFHKISRNDPLEPLLWNKVKALNDDGIDKLNKAGFLARFASWWRGSNPLGKEALFSNKLLKIPEDDFIYTSNIEDLNANSFEELCNYLMENNYNPLYINILIDRIPPAEPVHLFFKAGLLNHINKNVLNPVLKVKHIALIDKIFLMAKKVQVQDFTKYSLSLYPLGKMYNTLLTDDPFHKEKAAECYLYQLIEYYKNPYRKDIETLIGTGLQGLETSIRTSGLATRPSAIEHLINPKTFLQNVSYLLGQLKKQKYNNAELVGKLELLEEKAAEHYFNNIMKHFKSQKGADNNSMQLELEKLESIIKTSKNNPQFSPLWEHLINPLKYSISRTELAYTRREQEFIEAPKALLESVSNLLIYAEKEQPHNLTPKQLEIVINACAELIHDPVVWSLPAQDISHDQGLATRVSQKQALIEKMERLMALSGNATPQEIPEPRNATPEEIPKPEDAVLENPADSLSKSDEIAQELYRHRQGLGPDGDL